MKFIISILTDFSDDLKVEVISPHQLREKPPVKDLGFGKHFTDHMLRIKWSESKGWESPVICQMQNFQMHPAAKVSFLIFAKP